MNTPFKTKQEITLALLFICCCFWLYFCCCFSSFVVFFLPSLVVLLAFFYSVGLAECQCVQSPMPVCSLCNVSVLTLQCFLTFHFCFPLVQHYTFPFRIIISLHSEDLPKEVPLLSN